MNDDDQPVAEPRSGLPLELVATQNVGAHSYSSTIVSYLLLARFSEPKLEWTYTTPYLCTTRIKFQELPHEYAATPAVLPEPAYLFFFNEVGVQFWNYTSYENSIFIPTGVWNGVWTPAPFSFDTVKVGLRLDQEKIEIKSFKFNNNPLNKLWPFALNSILTVTIVEVDAGNPSSDTAIVRFYGDIVGIDSSYKATAVPFGNPFDRKFPRFLLSVSDNYTQFSSPTNIAASSFLTTGTIEGAPDPNSQTLVVKSVGAQTKINLGNSWQFPDDYYAAGWLETGTGSTFESRGILHSRIGTSTTVVLTLDRPLLKALASQSVKLYPGYDGSILRADQKFGNRINFGGHPYIPNVNPAVKAVKPKQVQGGKKG